MILPLFFNGSEKRDGWKVDVELDKIVVGPTISSKVKKTFFFNSSTSGTHSCTKIASLTSSSKLDVPEIYNKTMFYHKK